MPLKPRIHLIATGGTIAGVAPDPADTRNYTAGVLTAEQLIASVPPLKDLAEISVEQLYNLDSKDMTPDHWLGLARATQAALDRGDVDGVVITHGTDTMEESAFFLDCVLVSDKPVVFTGAMRPSNAISPDGPTNLLAAVSVAASAAGMGVGVVVVMDGRIHSALAVRKIRSSGLDAFSSGDAELLGTACPVVVTRRPLVGRRFNLRGVLELPKVELLWVVPGGAPEMLLAPKSLGAKGVVLVLPGCFSVPEAWMATIYGVQASGVAILVCSRCDAMGPQEERESVVAGLEASPLSPVKARIWLMLKLASQSMGSGAD